MVEDAVLKTDWGLALGGSNPSVSAYTFVRLDRNNVSTVAKRVRLLPRVYNAPSPNGDGTGLISQENMGSSPIGAINAPLAQLVEANGLNPLWSGFESQMAH